MAKLLLKQKAMELRIDGASVKDIAKKLQVSVGSVSLWCQNIKLSEAQRARLFKSKYPRMAYGRMCGALFQKAKKRKALLSAKKEAEKLKGLKKSEFFVAGLALYLAEGSKKMGRVQFTNSDPRVINFMLKWFNHFYHTTKNDIKCSILINKIHRKRDSKIKQFWQKYLKIKPEKFNDIRYIKTKQKKKYANFDQYFGTFSFRVNKSSFLLYCLNAFTDKLINLGLKNNWAK